MAEATKDTDKKNTDNTKVETSKFAIIATGGKQYLVHEGDTIKIELLAEKKEGDKVAFNEVLLVSDNDVKVGTPHVSGAKVEGTVDQIGKDKKIDVVRFRSKSRHHRRYGHRQHFAKVTIDSIA